MWNVPPLMGHEKSLKCFPNYEGRYRYSKLIMTIIYTEVLKKKRFKLAIFHLNNLSRTCLFLLWEQCIMGFCVLSFTGMFIIFIIYLWHWQDNRNSIELRFLFFINPLTILLDSNGLKMVTRYAMNDKTNKTINITLFCFLPNHIFV